MARVKEYVNINGTDFELHKSIYCSNESIVIVSDYMSGKMEGIPSISTSCRCNPFCQARQKSGKNVCSKCFSEEGLRYKPSLRNNLEHNFRVFNDIELPDEQIPIYKKWVEIARDESYGDVASYGHAYKYCQVANANPHVTFAMWTKNPWIWDDVFTKIGKPKNLICVLSSTELNKVTASYKRYSWVDKVFTVFTKEYLKLNPDIKINCGAKKCDSCRMCYTIGDDTFFVNELVKKDQKKKGRK